MQPAFVSKCNNEEEHENDQSIVVKRNPNFMRFGHSMGSSFRIPPIKTLIFFEIKKSLYFKVKIPCMTIQIFYGLDDFFQIPKVVKMNIRQMENELPQMQIFFDSV